MRANSRAICERIEEILCVLHDWLHLISEKKKSLGIRRIQITREPAISVKRNFIYLAATALFKFPTVGVTSQRSSATTLFSVYATELASAFSRKMWSPYPPVGVPPSFSCVVKNFQTIYIYVSDCRSSVIRPAWLELSVLIKRAAAIREDRGNSQI